MKFPSSLLALSLLAAGSAQAGVLDLGIGNANVYTLHNFSASGSDVEGAIVSAGNVSLSNYSVNLKDKDAYSGYAAVVGGNFNYSSGSLLNGKYYVGGTTAFSSLGTAGASASSTLPLSFAATSATVKASSLALANDVATTGTAAIVYSGLALTGSNKSVEVFDLTSSMVSSSSYLQSMTGVAAGATLIFNVSGTSGSFSGGLSSLSNFGNYNVLWNFYEATNLSINTGVSGSILAPLASVNGGNGVVNGNVIVDNWSSNIQINANHYFNSATVAGYNVPAAVPEPETYGMLLAGLAALGLVARRRKSAAAGAVVPAALAA